MITRHIAPGQVRFGPGALSALTQGSRALLIGEPWVLESLAQPLGELLQRQRVFSILPSAQPFGGECTLEEIHSWVIRGKQEHADLVVGIGGGRALDTAKAVAFHLRCLAVTIPTSAATCAAWSALSAINSPEGAQQEYLLLDRAPEVMIIDPVCFLVKGPVAPGRLLAAGMADALAKYHESHASTHGRYTDALTQVALDLSQRIHDVIFQQGLTAQQELAKGRWTPAVEQLVIVNIAWAGMVGGLGGEKCRAVAAHALSNGLTHILPPRSLLHGETVGYGILLQLALERKLEELQALETLFRSLGLPTTLEELELDGTARAHLPEAFRVALDPKETLRNLPFPVTADDLSQAVETVEALAPKLSKPSRVG
ncbi:MAG: iron-containing alcohol dehydrogenase [Elusimicrobia bacterium]|nr:iron-containing alcohol dehydrogenase [Elusimicrobiota bacterium]